jgi:hypothetical protein
LSHIRYSPFPHNSQWNPSKVKLRYTQYNPLYLIYFASLKGDSIEILTLKCVRITRRIEIYEKSSRIIFNI